MSNVRSLLLLACLSVFAPSVHALECAPATCGTVEAHLMPGVSAGDKIEAAIAALPAGVGGYVDATGFANPQNLTGFTVPPGVTVQLGPIFYTLNAATPIIVNQGGHLLGAGRNSPGATTIKLFTANNHEIVKAISTNGENDWWHHGSIRNIRFLCNKANNTSGHCVSIYGLGETSTVAELAIESAAESGIYFHGSQSGTGTVRNVTVNNANTYGIQLDEFRSGISMWGVGGDHNGSTLGITGPRTGGGSIMLMDFKSEGSGPGPDIVIEGGSASVMLSLLGGNTLTVDPNKTFIRMTGTVSHHVSIEGMVLGNTYGTIIDDQVNSYVVPIVPNSKLSMLHYYQGQWIKFDGNGLSTFPLIATGPVDPVPDPGTPPPTALLTLDFLTDLGDFTTQTVGAGQTLAWTAVPLLGGVSGDVAVTMVNTNPVYGTTTFPAIGTSPTTLRIQLDFDPNSVTMNSGEQTTTFQVRPTANILLGFSVRRAAPYQVTMLAYNDGGTGLSYIFVPITDEPHAIEFILTKSSSAGTADAVVQGYIDGVLVWTSPNKVIFGDFETIDTIQFGGLSSIDAGTSGTMYFGNVRLEATN